MSEGFNMSQIPVWVLVAGSLIIVYIIYAIIHAKSQSNNDSKTDKPEHILSPTPHVEDPTKPKITLEELAKHDGVQKPTTYVSLMNVIFDVTGSESYKPSGTYGKFAGKECSVALVKMSMDDKYFNCYEEHRAALGESESLKGWLDFMKKKYPVVGYVYSPKKDD